MYFAAKAPALVINVPLRMEMKLGINMVYAEGCHLCLMPFLFLLQHLHGK